MTNLRPHEVENTFLIIIASSQILVVPEVEKIKHGYQDTKYKSTSLKVEVTTGHSFVKHNSVAIFFLFLVLPLLKDYSFDLEDLSPKAWKRL